MATARRRYAFLGAPYLGGIYTVFRALRRALELHGIEVRWVATGVHAAAVMRDPQWSHEHQTGEAVQGKGSEDGAALVAHLSDGSYDGVFVNVRMRPTEMNVVRYLPIFIRRIMIVHSTQPGTYAPAAALRHHVHATVGVSTRIADDLVARRGFSRNDTTWIHTGVDLADYGVARSGNPPFRLLYLGRVEDTQKGVFWLPDLMARLVGEPVTLTVAGDGPDLNELQRRCNAVPMSVTFTGAIRAKEVPEVLANHDALIMPSRFEGLGLSMVEAMAAGCVPVVSRLVGVTDKVIADGVNGRLFAVGDMREAADCVRGLLEDHDACERMSHAARVTVREHFSLNEMGRSYADLIDGIAEKPLPSPPLDIADWRYPLAFDNPLRRLVPTRVRQWILAGR